MTQHICPDCKNVFLQPFRCTTCAAQKLYDTTLRQAEQRAERAEADLSEARGERDQMVRNTESLLADLAAARALLREALAAITGHATQRTFAGGVVLSNTAIKIRAALAAPGEGK